MMITINLFMAKCRNKFKVKFNNYSTIILLATVMILPEAEEFDVEINMKMIF